MYMLIKRLFELLFDHVLSYMHVKKNDAMMQDKDEKNPVLNLNKKFDQKSAKKDVNSKLHRSREDSNLQSSDP